MSKHENTYQRVISGTANANVQFGDLCSLLEKLGFQRKRVSGDHHIYTKTGVPDIINLQPARDGKAKPYQVKQIRLLIEHNQLTIK